MSSEIKLPATNAEHNEDSNAQAYSKSSEDVQRLNRLHGSGPKLGQTSPSVEEVQSDLTPTQQHQDGGTRAWFQVLGAFVLCFNIWGYAFSFGSFQNFYEDEYLPDSSASQIAWIGGIQAFFLVFAAIFAGPLFDLGYFKTMLSVGAVLTTFGAVMLSLSTQYWQILLSQGVCVGVGCGVMFSPLTAFIARSFVRRRSLALGVMSCGAPIGAVVFSFIFEGTLPRYGFAWTARIMAFFMIAVYLIGFPLVSWRVTNVGDIGNGGRRKLVDREALTDLTFWAYACAYTLMFMIYMTPFIFMPTYAQTKLGTSRSYASYVLIIAQVASIPGRFASAIAADKFGVMAPWTCCGTIASIICFSWIAVKDLPGFIAFCALYGCFGGGLIPLATSILPRVCPNRQVLGTRLGMVQSISSISSLIGPPIAGALLNVGYENDHNWLALQLWCGIALLFSVAWMFVLWVLLVKQRRTKIFI